MGQKNRILLILFIVVLSWAGIFAAEEARESDVKISWEEFKKLLKLDAAEISLSWDEFSLLLAQTGQTGKVNYTVNNGRVVLPRDQFKRLLDAMKPPVGNKITPPADYIITKAEYSGVMKKDATEIYAKFWFEVFASETPKYYSIPFLPEVAALQEVRLNNQPCLVMVSGSWYQVTTKETGQMVLSVKYLVPSSLDKGPDILNLWVQRTPITLLKLTIPLKNAAITIPSAKQLVVLEKGDSTIIDAVLSATSGIAVQAHRKLSEITEASADLPAKIYAETLNLLSIEEDAMRVTCHLKLTILQNKVGFIEVRIPKNYNVLYVKDANDNQIRDWKTSKKEEQDILRIPFDSPSEGDEFLAIIAEHLFESETNTLDFNGFQVQGAVRETGYIGAEKQSTAEATTTEMTNLDRIDLKDLPYDLVQISQRPLLFGFRYLRHPFFLKMELSKHQELPSISSVIDMASVITVILEDGKILTKAVYTIRNTWKQYLELTLPEGAEIWTAYVGKQRVTASKTEDGKIKIPLQRSEMENDVIKPFDVDLIYFYKAKPWKILGRRNLNFPIADVLISKMLWSVYLPNSYQFLRFSGNVDKEEMAATMNLILGKRRELRLDQIQEYTSTAIEMEKSTYQPHMQSSRQKLLKSKFSNMAFNDLDIARQMKQEANLNVMVQQEQQKGLGQPGAGQEMLKIELPTSGQIFRFNKTVIEKESLDLNAFYVSGWLVVIIKIVLILMALGILLLLSKRIWRWLKIAWQWLKNQQQFWNFFKTKSGLRLSLLLATVFCLYHSGFLFVILSLLLLVSIFRPDTLQPHLYAKPAPAKIIKKIKSLFERKPKDTPPPPDAPAAKGE